MENLVVESIRLETPAETAGAGCVGAVAAQQHAHMHFVGLAFQPLEESADAIPTVALVVVVGVFAASFLAVDHEILIRFRQLLERHPHVDLLARARPEQVLLRFAHLFAAKNTHGAARDRNGTIGNRAFQIDADGTAEATALRTSAQRAVETEQPRRGRPDIDVAVRAMPADRKRRFLLRLEIDEVDAVLAETERCFDRFRQAGAILFRERDPVLDDLDPGAETRRRFTGIAANDLAGQPDAEVALLLQELEKISRLRLRRHADPEGDEHRPAGQLTQYFLRDGRSGLRPNLPPAARAKRLRDARPEELQVIVDLRHRADGRAR